MVLHTAAIVLPSFSVWLRWPLRPGPLIRADAQTRAKSSERRSDRRSPLENRTRSCVSLENEHGTARETERIFEKERAGRYPKLR